MKNRFDYAELFVSIWKLGDGKENIPLSGGFLDRALEAVIEFLPESVSSNMHFSSTSVGRRCLELPDILLAAEECLLVETKGDTFSEARVRLSESHAREIVVDFGISTASARNIGTQLKKLASEKRSHQKPEGTIRTRQFR